MSSNYLGPYPLWPAQNQPPPEPHVKPDKSWGTGIWIAKHLDAAEADTPVKSDLFCKQIRHICSNLPCPSCINDAMSYIAANPPEKSTDVFVWMHGFHNHVNQKLGKPLMPYAEARDLYYGGKIKVCSSGCGETTQVGPIKTPFNRT